MLAKKNEVEDYSPVLLTKKGDTGQEADRRSHRKHGEQRSQTTTSQRRIHHNLFRTAHKSGVLTEHHEHPNR